MNNETVLEHDRKLQRIINAYHRVFEEPEGKIVMEDLQTVFGLDRPAYLPLEDRDGGMRYDETHGKLRDGQRSVFLHIAARLRKPAQGDDNIKEPKLKVIRP
jgi:hypothetical protein